MPAETWNTPTLAECDPGIAPREYQVLLVMSEKSEKTAGGILLPSAIHDRAQWGADHARILAVSPFAFSYEKDWGDTPKPRSGDIVYVGKFPGDEIAGRDGRSYRLCDDRQVKAVMVLEPLISAAQLAALNTSVEAMFAECGQDITTMQTPGGSTCVVFANGGIKLEGEPPIEPSDEPTMIADALKAIRAFWPDHSRMRMHWRVRPELGSGPKGSVLYLRLGADLIEVKEPVNG